MGMPTSVCCCQRTFCMRMRRHLRCGQCDSRSTTCFFYCCKVCVVCIHTDWNTARSPSHPSASKVGGRVGILDTHVDTSDRIKSTCEFLDVILQQFAVDLYIPFFRYLKAIVCFRYLTNGHTLATTFKVHDYRCRRYDVSDADS